MLLLLCVACIQEETELFDLFLKRSQHQQLVQTGSHAVGRTGVRISFV